MIIQKAPFKVNTPKIYFIISRKNFSKFFKNIKFLVILDV